MTTRHVPLGQAARTLWRTFGARGAARRARFEVRRRLNLFDQRASRMSATAAALPSSVYSPAAAYGALGSPYRERALAAAERVATGWHHAFGGDWRAIPADATAWRTDPVSGMIFDDVVWWRIPHLPPNGDIKNVWEPARFAWTYDLVRAYTLTRERRFAEAFAQHLQSWWCASPAFRGPHWSCGQETAIRALALLHAEAVLVPALQDERVDLTVREILWASGERIANAIEYGLSQRNNHGISESAALIHLGFRFEGEHPAAARWRRVGLRWLCEQVRDQFAPDGWYAQHSFTYMRTALDQAVLAQRILSAHGLSMPADCLDRLRRSVALMCAAVSSETGFMPNHGANDGGRVVTYSSAPYRDFRPALTLAAVVLKAPLPADVTADQEVVAWLGAKPVAGPARTEGVTTGASGWAVARAGDVSVFCHAGALAHRPSHLDSLHIDVRAGGHEIVNDPGTYSYNGAPPWRNGLVAAALHNGPVVNDQEPGVRGPRFIWWAWPLAELVDTGSDGEEAVFTARLLDPSSRIPIAERRVHVTSAGVRVDDRHLLPTAATVQVTWLIQPGAPVRIAVYRRSGSEGPLVSEHTQDLDNDERTTAGWFSPTYGVKIKQRALRVRASEVDRDMHLVTQFDFGKGKE